MELKELWATLRRRWYLVLVTLLAAAAAGFLVVRLVGPTYSVQSTVVLLPPGTTVTGGTATTGNPYLALSGVSQARDVVIRSLMSATTHEELCAQKGDAAFTQMRDQLCKSNPGVIYTATPDFTSSAPMILITVEGNTKENAATGLKAVTDVVPTKLTQLQSSLSLPDRSLITSTPVVVDKDPSVVRKDEIRAGIVAVGGVLGLGLLAIALLEGLIGSRRPHQEEPVAKPKPRPKKKAQAADWGWSANGEATHPEPSRRAEPARAGETEPTNSAAASTSQRSEVATAKR